MPVLIWLGFLAAILLLLALDLGVFHRKDRAIPVKIALAWTGFWVALALAFNVFVYYLYEFNWLGFGAGSPESLRGGQASLLFFTGYVVEKSLSLDNIFVIALIFAYFSVPLEYQHRVLYWGILGALVMRGAMIAAGAALITRFAWVTYAFGILLILTAVKMLVARHDNLEPGRNPIVRLLRRFLPVTDRFHESRFFVRLDESVAMTPLFLALLVVETSDLLFAVDSIPAIFAITDDPFIVFTSNVFAILGLRSLYFALAGTIHRFRYLKASLVFLLAFVGVKMLLVHHHPIPTPVSLAIIGGILTVGVLASVLSAKRDTAKLVSPLVDDLEELTRVGLRQARRIVILVAGSTVLLLGLAMIVLPGPAIVVIPTGLGILALEFVWARRWLRRIRASARLAKRSLR